MSLCNPLPLTPMGFRRPAQYVTLDELLDKLLFLAVSGDGGSITSFYLFP